MPREVAPPKPGTKPGTKKAPLGIPTWGWIAAIGLGLVIGYLMIRNKGSAASDNSSAESSGESPLNSPTGKSGGGGVASPSPDILPITQTLTDGGNMGGGQGDSFTSLMEPVNNPSLKPGNQPAPVWIQPSTNPGTAPAPTYNPPPGIIWTGPTSPPIAPVKPGIQM